MNVDPHPLRNLHRSRMYQQQRRKGLIFPFPGFPVVVWRTGNVVNLVDKHDYGRAIKGDSVPEAKQVMRAMSDLALKATQFEHTVTSLDYVVERVISMVHGATWFANRRARTF